MDVKYKFREEYLSVDKLMENGMFLCGSPETVSERLAELQGKMGFGQLVTMLQFGTLSAELTEKNTRLFAAEVMPKLREVGVSPTVAAE
jgi:alkanesulfonate monooxygenase SsuD/methylene tetrahydromethanopterin reductase-like flavin-dependent oxidoreductase (luciferase family)